MLAQSWRTSAPLLVLDEIHKMPAWKSWLKGVADGRAPGQQLLVTGSARMDTFRQSGESLAGRYFKLRLHPLSVREWSEQMQTTPQAALTHLLARGGFPEPALANTDDDAQRWRNDYFAGLVREDVLEFSRLQEVSTMRLFAEMLRSRVPSTAMLESMGAKASFHFCSAQSSTVGSTRMSDHRQDALTHDGHDSTGSAPDKPAPSRP